MLKYAANGAVNRHEIAKMFPAIGDEIGWPNSPPTIRTPPTRAKEKRTAWPIEDTICIRLDNWIIAQTRFLNVEVETGSLPKRDIWGNVTGREKPPRKSDFVDYLLHLSLWVCVGQPSHRKPFGEQFPNDELSFGRGATPRW